MTEGTSVVSGDLAASLILELRDRRIYRIGRGAPAVWLSDDRTLGGVLINAPTFSPDVLRAIQARTWLACPFPQSECVNIPMKCRVLPCRGRGAATLL
jgi:hypothetical protein